jgi:hypothetical protein
MRGGLPALAERGNRGMPIPRLLQGRTGSSVIQR